LQRSNERPPGDGPRITREGPSPKLIAGGVGLLLVIVFMLQNGDEIAVRFLFWDGALPQWAVIAVTLVVGVFVGRVWGGVRRRAKDRRTASGEGRPDERPDEREG